MAAPIPLPIPPTSKANHPSSTPDSAYDFGSVATLAFLILARATDVSFGSKADIEVSLRNVRFTPKSGHR
jgi:hypothetical protein